MSEEIKKNIGQCINKAKLDKFAPNWKNMSFEAALAEYLLNSGSFDSEFYLKAYPDVARSGLNPLAHYLLFGMRENRKFAFRDNSTEMTVATEKPVISEKPLNIDENDKEHSGEAITAVKNDSVPEKSRIYRQGCLENLYGDYLAVNWLITSMCNYNCSSCFGHDPLDRKKFHPFESLATAVDNIAALNRSGYEFVFGGGEPTTHPRLFDLIAYIRDKIGERLNHITIISNASRQNDLYERLANMAGAMNINLVLSLHTEFLDLNHIAELVERLSHSICICFNFMFNPAKREFCREIFTRLLELRKSCPFNLTIMLLRVGPTFSLIDPRYTPEDFQWRNEAYRLFNEAATKSGRMSHWRTRFKKTKYWDWEKNGHRVYESMQNCEPSDLLKNGMLDFKNMYCMMGTAVLAIGSSGLVYGAQCYAPPKRYDIYRENPYFHEDFIEPVLCPLENCGCEVNHVIPKFADRREAEEYAAMFRAKQKDKLK